jgi:hypothetical protein
MAERYRIRVSNRLGPVLCNAFTGMRAVEVPRQTVVEGALSRDEFRALLLRVAQQRIQLIRVQCAGEESLGSRRGIVRGLASRSD